MVQIKRTQTCLQCLCSSHTLVFDMSPLYPALQWKGFLQVFSFKTIMMRLNVAFLHQQHYMLGSAYSGRRSWPIRADGSFLFYCKCCNSSWSFRCDRVNFYLFNVSTKAVKSSLTVSSTAIIMSNVTDPNAAYKCTESVGFWGPLSISGSSIYCLSHWYAQTFSQVSSSSGSVAQMS